MNHRLIIAGALLSAIPVALFAQKKSKEQKKMNVLFVIADDLRPTLGCYGDRYAVTPNIDKIASNGVVFNRAYCQQALSNPSRTSLLTGLRPDKAGVSNLTTHFRTTVPDIVTLPQLFKDNGYYCVSTGKVFHIFNGKGDPISWSEPEKSGMLKREYFHKKNITESGGKRAAAEAADIEDNRYPDGNIAEYAIEYLKKAKQQENPFFLAVGFRKPHLPFCAPQKYWDLYNNTKFEIEHRGRPDNSPDIAFHNREELRAYKDVPNQGEFTPEIDQRLSHGYYACVSFIDAQLGKIMQSLDELGMSENTIIVFWGDHGYHLGEQDLWCKSTNFELAAKVPLVVSIPKAKDNGKMCEAIVEVVDIYPTLADYCGLKQPEHLAGVSLKPLLNNTSAKWNYNAYNQILRPYGAINKPIQTHIGYSVRTDEWRCTYWYDYTNGEVVARELYNMKGAGIEQENLSGVPKYANIEKRLSGSLAQYKEGKYSKR